MANTSRRSLKKSSILGKGAFHVLRRIDEMPQESRTMEEETRGYGSTVSGNARREVNPEKDHLSIGTSVTSTRKSYPSSTRRLVE